jgi:hypothetical protein
MACSYRSGAFSPFSTKTVDGSCTGCELACEYPSFLALLTDLAIEMADKEPVPILFQQLLGAAVLRRKGGYDFHGVYLLKSVMY